MKKYYYSDGTTSCIRSFDKVLHREDGPAVIDGDFQEWCINGKQHREDGPAVIDGDFKVYYINDERHRLDGPAFIDGDYQEWFINNKWLTEEEFEVHPERVAYLARKEIERLIC